MKELTKAREPFNFYTRLNLQELTGIRTCTIAQLLEHLKTVPGSCIYYHTHRFLQQHQYLSPEPPNDFAHWVIEALGDDQLGEQLSSIDTIQFSSIRELREKLIATVADYLEQNPSSGARQAREDEEFYFIKSVSFVIPTQYIARDLKEFIKILRKITINAIYFHIFEARLRLGKGTNDFSNWIETSLGDQELARQLSRLDPYTYTLEELRKTIITLIKHRISS
jgi:hypothetical protein